VNQANYFLEQQLDLADKDLDDRLVQHLMKDPEGDGGQWDSSSFFSPFYPLPVDSPSLVRQ
jgi:aminopeptidase C